MHTKVMTGHRPLGQGRMGVGVGGGGKEEGERSPRGSYQAETQVIKSKVKSHTLFMPRVIHTDNEVE